MSASTFNSTSQQRWRSFVNGPTWKEAFQVGVLPTFLDKREEIRALVPTHWQGTSNGNATEESLCGP